MQRSNKQRILSIIMIITSAQSVHANELIATATAPAAPIQLAAVQPSDAIPAKTMSEMTHEGKPSMVLMAVGYENGKSYPIVAPFTPEEIAKYPDYKKVFANHAAYNFGSSNPQDVTAIVHLIHAHPDMAKELAQYAANYQGSVHRDIKKALRPPVMTLALATKITAQTVGYGTAGAYGWALKELLDREAILREFVHDDKAVDLIGNMSAPDPYKSVTNFAQGLPRAIPVAITTAAVTHVALHELEERFGDPLPCPKYDAKSRNIGYYSCVGSKWALKIAFSMAVSQAINKSIDAAQSSFSRSNK